MAKDKEKQEGGDAGAEQQAGTQGPSEEELRAQLEEEIRNVRVEDVLLQSIASILNLSARRIAKEDERDLEQAKIGIDAAIAVVDLLPEEPRGQVQQAISELQMLYAKEAGGDGADSGEGADSSESAGGESAGEEKPKAGGKGGAEAKKGEGDSKLWTPGS